MDPQFEFKLEHSIVFFVELSKIIPDYGAARSVKTLESDTVVGTADQVIVNIAFAADIGFAPGVCQKADIIANILNLRAI